MADRREIARWALHFEADPAAAAAARQEFKQHGQLDANRQLGLSVALTPPEHLCSHYGDARYCPLCVEERFAEEQATEQRAQEQERLVASKDKELHRRATVIDNQSSEIERLRRAYHELHQQYAAAQSRRRWLRDDR